MTKEVKKRFLRAMRTAISERWNGVKTKKMFAEELGISPQLLYQLESEAQRIPTVEQICLLCAKFGVSPMYIILGKEPVSMKETKSLEDRIKKLEKSQVNQLVKA